MILDRISEMTQRWFLSEEALFSVFCTHKVVENRDMKCHARVGKGLIEVNPKLCDDITDRELEERLRIELIRILLKHPYDRQPDGCCSKARALGSNCIISDSYKLQRVKMEHPTDFNLPGNGHFEFYARQIQRMLEAEQSRGQNHGNDGTPSQGQGNGDGQDDNGTSDIAQNWEQDELMTATVNDVIKNVNSWGTLGASIVEQIVASTQARIDYRQVLAGFRATVLSQSRRLTRMRPNRRSGFEAMGSRYDFNTRLIVGVDVSGSIHSEDLKHFYTTINNFFQYGIKDIDVVQFDTTLGEIVTLSKATEKVTVKGRGGTCFQPFIDFVARHPEYDGALIYTDGYAAEPSIPPAMRTPLCWIVRNEQQLRQHEGWMSKSGRVCMIETP